MGGFATVALALGVGIGFTTAARSEEPFKIRVTCQVRDYETGALIAPEGVSATSEGPAYSATRSGSAYELDETVSLGTPEALTVNVEVNTPYQPRRVRLRRLPDEQVSILRSLELFLVKDEFSAPLTEVIKAAHLLDLGKIDRALALLEREYERIGPAYAHRHKLAIRYNYARAALDACLHLGYDTCGLANEQCHKLGDDLAANPQWIPFMAGVKPEEVTRCAALAKGKIDGEAQERIRLAVEAAEKKIAQGGSASLDGVREMEVLLSDLREGELTSLSRPAHALERDAGVGLMRYERHIKMAGASAEEREEHLHRAIAHFESAIAGGDRSAATAMDLQNARERLETIQREIASSPTPIG
jgi:hypothetical protein